MKNCKVCTSQEYFYLFNFFAKLKSSVESKNLKRFRFRKPAEQKEEQGDWILEWRQVWGLVVWKLLKGEQCVMPETMDDPHCFFSCPYLLLSIHLDVEPVPAWEGPSRDSPCVM